MIDYYSMVKEFQDACGDGSRSSSVPKIPSQEDVKVCVAIMDEEFRELLVAMIEEDLPQIAKEAADLLYVVFDTCYAYGIPIDDVFRAVHESNMTKVGSDGKVVYREDGKIMKGANYQAPNIGAILYGLNEDLPEHEGRTIEARRFS